MALPTSTIGVEIEKTCALLDAQQIIHERGKQISIRLHEETTVTRDRFNSIKKRSESGITFYSYPINFNPTEKEISDSGIREKTQVTAKTAVQDWIDAGYTMATLKDINSIRGTVIIDGAKYEIKDKVLESQFADVFLYVLLGLNRI